MEELRLFSISSIVLASLGLALSLLVRARKAKKKAKEWNYAEYLEDSLIDFIIDIFSVISLMIIADTLMWWVSLKAGSEDATQSIEAVIAFVIGYGGHSLFVGIKRITVGIFKKYIRKYLDRWFPPHKDN